MAPLSVRRSLTQPHEAHVLSCPDCARPKVDDLCWFCNGLVRALAMLEHAFDVGAPFARATKVEACSGNTANSTVLSA